MTDYFALLGQGRRPWLDDEILKQKFLTLSQELHPDRAGVPSAEPEAEANTSYAELNAAYQCLREPKCRLQHLLTLERGSKPTDLQNIPADLMDRFLRISAVCRQVDAFLGQKSDGNSPLLKLARFEEGQGVVAKIDPELEGLRALETGLMKHLQELDARWPGAGEKDAGLLDEVEQVYRLCGFYGRWRQSLQERKLRLTLME